MRMSAWLAPLRAEDRQWAAACWLSLAALMLCACTPIEKVSSKQGNATRAPVDFDDLWVAAGYPCGGKVIPLPVRVEQVDTMLTAVSLSQSECTEYGQRVWLGTLPHAPVSRSELPLKFEVELTVADGKPSVRGSGTVVSNDRMLLDVGASPLIVTRAEAAEIFANVLKHGDFEKINTVP
jgi:hypothetical protein